MMIVKMVVIMMIKMVMKMTVYSSYLVVELGCELASGAGPLTGA